MRGKGDALFVFVNLLTHTDENGIVDRHWQAIIDETGLPKERVLSALNYLSEPDADSKTPDEEGRRIILLDNHRTWGWRVVNHAKYRALCTKAQNAERQARFRERNAGVTHGNIVPVGVTVGVTEKEGIVKGVKKFVQPTPEEVTEYATSIGFALDGHEFCDHYIGNGWMVGKTHMKDWQATVRTWKHRNKTRLSMGCKAADEACRGAK